MTSQLWRTRYLASIGVGGGGGAIENSSDDILNIQKAIKIKIHDDFSTCHDLWVMETGRGEKEKCGCFAKHDIAPQMRGKLMYT